MFDGGSDRTHVSYPTPRHSPIGGPDADIGRIQFMRDLLLFFGVKFKVTPFSKTARPAGDQELDEEDEEEERNPTLQVAEGKQGTGEVLVSCLGVGYSNVNKSMA